MFESKEKKAMKAERKRLGGVIRQWGNEAQAVHETYLMILRAEGTQSEHAKDWFSKYHHLLAQIAITAQTMARQGMFDE